MRDRAPRALGVLALFVGLVSTGVLDIATGAVLAAAGMALARCLTIQQAYRAVDWDVILLLAGFMGLGVAFRESGLAADAAQGLVWLLSDSSTWLLVGVVFLVTAALTNLLSNTAIAVLMIPVVVEVSRLTGASISMLLMTVAFAASAAFSSPLGYQTNLLVYAPGGYRFRDYVIVGLPLTLLFTVLAAAFIPLIHGAGT